MRQLQDYYIYIDPLPIPEIVSLINKILLNNNLTIEADGQARFCLNDYESDDDEFSFSINKIKDSKTDLNKIKYHPTGGWICYQYKKSNVLIGFEPICSPLNTVDTISFSMSLYEYSFHNKKIDFLLKDLHKKVNAIRTIGGENISEDVDTVKNELINTQQGLFKNKYPVDWKKL